MLKELRGTVIEAYRVGNDLIATIKAWTLTMRDRLRTRWADDLMMPDDGRERCRS